MPSQMNEHVGGTENICPEELSICFFAEKSNELEKLSYRGEIK